MRTYQISEEVLEKAIQVGAVSEMALTRLEFAQYNQILTHYIRKLAVDEAEGGFLRAGRVHPNMLPTQASGRWSTTAPPLPNFTASRKYGKKGIRDVVIPDAGQVWVGFDLDAIEAKFVAAASHDKADLEAFRKGWDIHTTTACAMYRWPLPPFEPTKRNVFGPTGEDWRAMIYREFKRPEPYVDDGRDRTLAKNCRYCLGYGDPKAMSRYAVEMRIPASELIAEGERYLQSKPNLVAWKQRTWNECMRTREARAYVGGQRRRLTTPTAVHMRMEAAKQGLNHRIQSSVAAEMDMAILAITDRWPECALGWNKHDGAILKFPRDLGLSLFEDDKRTPTEELRLLVERDWVIEGETITSTATWELYEAPEDKQ